MATKFPSRFILLALSAAAHAAPLDDAYLLAARRLAAGRASEALSAFGDAMTARPESVEGHFQRGLDWRAKQKRVHAGDEFGEAAKIAANHAPSLAARGLMHYELRQLDDALIYAEAAIAADPRCAFGYFLRGRIAHMQGKYDPEQARRDFTKAIECDPKMAWAYYCRNGVEDLDRSIELDPREPHFFEARGNSRVLEKRFAEARRDYEQAMSLDPTYAYYPIEHAEAGLLSGDVETGLKEVVKALKRSMNVWAKAYGEEVRGRALSRLGRFDEARQAFDLAIKCNASRLFSLRGRAFARLVAGDFPGAITDSEKAIELSPGDIGALQIRIYALFAAEHYLRARGAANEALRDAEPNDEGAPYYALMASFSERRLGHEPGAKKALTQWSGKAWPRPVFDFLLGKTSRDQLLAAAKNRGEQTEAHAYLGLLAEDRGETLQQLRWVAASGDQSFNEYPLALAEIKRLETLEKPATPPPP